MRVTTDHFFTDCRSDLLERESPSLRPHLGVHHNMEQQVAEFLAQVGIIRAFDGIDDLVAFLDEQRPEGGVRLLAIPRAAIRSAEAGDNFLQAGDAV